MDHNYLTPAEFAVNGSGIPEVDFDAGESYAGTLSIDDNADNDNQLFFWFWPSENPNATDEIVIWLNGGPGYVSSCKRTNILTSQMLVTGWVLPREWPYPLAIRNLQASAKSILLDQPNQYGMG